MRRLLSLLALSTVTLSHAQQTPQAIDGIVTLKSTARLVTVDVAVTDSKGAPVTGLTCADFQLLDKKILQSLRNCEDHTDPAALPAPPPQKLPPNVFTNTNAVPLPPTLDVFVFDFRNTGGTFGDIAKMRDSLRDVLTKPIPGHRVAVFALGGSVHLLSGFSDDGITDKALLQSKIMAASGFIGGSQPITSGRGLLQSQTANIQQLNHVEATVDQMRTIAAFLAPLPGRKRLIWVAGASAFNMDHGMSMSNQGDHAEGFDRFRELSNDLVENRIQIFPVDVNGVVNYVDAAGSFTRPTTFRGVDAQLANETSYRFVLDTIAADTGGKAFYGSNSLEDLLKKALDYGNSFYTLTYTPSNFKPDGSFHELKISVVERKVHLNHRDGYLAPDEKVERKVEEDRLAAIEATGKKPLPERTPAEKTVAQAMMRGLPNTTSVLFSVRIVPPATLGQPRPLKTRQQEEGDMYGIDFSINAADITWTPKDDLQTAAVKMRLAVYDGVNNSIETKEASTVLRLTPAQFAKARSQGLQLHFDIPLRMRSGSHLRVGMEDMTSHRIGTVEIDNGLLLASAAGTTPSQTKQP